MSHVNQKKIEWDTSRGKVKLTSFCNPHQIASLSFTETGAKYPRYKPIISKKEHLIRICSQPDVNVTIASSSRGEIVGIGLLQSPAPNDRWNKVGQRMMMEVSAVEVNRAWRSMRIAQKIAELVVDHPLKEDLILYMVGYSWTWDLDGTQMQVMDYRNMLVKFGHNHGFKIYQTNEPNVLLRPENLFMARIGKHVSEDIEKRFKLIRFNLDVPTIAPCNVRYGLNFSDEAGEDKNTSVLQTLCLQPSTNYPAISQQ